MCDAALGFVTRVAGDIARRARAELGGVDGVVDEGRAARRVVDGAAGLALGLRDAARRLVAWRAGDVARRTRAERGGVGRVVDESGAARRVVDGLALGLR